MEFEPGDRFGDLVIEREIGRGAFAAVYLAQDTLIGRPVALKVLRVQGADARRQMTREQLLEEARVAGRIRSPHVATLYRVHPLPHDDGWAIEMEYVDGGTLADLLGKDRSLRHAQITEILGGILRGLKAAHEAGIVHGDVKPGNVLFGSSGAVKLVDFGLSRLMGDPSLSRSSSVELVGTPVFMSPEIVMGEKPSAASDIWSTGVICYRMLTGRLPFPAQNLTTLFYSIQNAAPTPLDPGLPQTLCDLTLRCLSKSADERPASVQEALSLVVPYRPGEISTPTPLPAPTVRLFGRTHEKQLLRGAVRDVLVGHGGTVLISGETGIGKSALAHDTMEYSARLGIR